MLNSATLALTCQFSGSSILFTLSWPLSFNPLPLCISGSARNFFRLILTPRDLTTLRNFPIWQVDAHPELQSSLWAICLCGGSFVFPTFLPFLSPPPSQSPAFCCFVGMPCRLKDSRGPLSKEPSTSPVNFSPVQILPPQNRVINPEQPLFCCR